MFTFGSNANLSDLRQYFIHKTINLSQSNFMTNKSKDIIDLLNRPNKFEHVKLKIDCKFKKN